MPPAEQNGRSLFNSTCTQLPLPVLPQSSWDAGGSACNACASWPTTSSQVPAIPLAVSDMPPISQMLLQEADAWRALLRLHGSVVGLSRGIAAQSVHEATRPELCLDEKGEASAQREASYIAGLAQLIAQCDTMVAEATKIRGLRKAKHQLEVQALSAILRTHSDEVLAVGEALARNSAMSIASATSEVRQAAQSTRVQIQQTRVLLQATAELRAVGNVGPASEVVLGWRDANGDVHDVRPVAKVLEQVYQRGQLTDENVRAAIWEGDAPGVMEASAYRTFARRSGGRDAQQQLVESESSETAAARL